MADSQPRQTATVKLQLRVLGEAVDVVGEVPEGKIRIDEVLPLLLQIDNAAIDQAVKQSERAGRPISCCRGCSTCCRAQPVPVTPVEALALWRLVAALPEPRQAEIRARFDDRCQRLADAGLVAAYLERDASLSNEEARDIARRYFELGLACPFLAEDGACGIYTQRPFVCRQYLVTSPAKLCENPLDNPVDVLPIPIAGASAVLKVSSELIGREQLTIPLTLALEYVERHRAELEKQFDSQEVTRRCVEAMVLPSTNEEMSS